MPKNLELNQQHFMNLLASVSDKPLMVDSAHSQNFLESFASAMVDGDKTKTQQSHLQTVAAGFAEGREPTAEKPFVFAQGFAVIPVHGALLNRYAYSSESATGYNFIRSQLNAAMADDDVESVIYDVSTPGGHAAGCFELAGDIHQASQVKPSLALVDPYALSAGMGIAAAASHISLTESSYAGSIGVLTSHADLSGLLEKFGVSMELLYEGARKVDGNPFGPLSDEARAGAKNRLSVLYSRFVSQVAQMRNLSEDTVRNTEAAVFSAADAQNLGLIDGISSPEQAITQFQANRQRASQHRNTAMNPASQQQQAPAPAQQQAPAPAQQQAPAPAQQQAPAPAQQQAPAPAQQQAPAPAQQQQAPQDGASAERLRVKTILGSEEGKANPNLANHLAFETATGAEAAVATMRAAGPAAGASSDTLGTLMDNSGGGPSVPLAVQDGDDDNGSGEQQVGSSAILGAMGRSAAGANNPQH